MKEKIGKEPVNKKEELMEQCFDELVKLAKEIGKAVQYRPLLLTTDAEGMACNFIIDNQLQPTD